MQEFRRSLRILIRRNSRDLLTTIALCVLIAGTFFAILNTGVPGDQLIRWTGFSLTTAVIFWYAIADRSASLKRRPLWLAITLLALAHGVTWTIVLKHVEHWRFFWFGPVISVEIVAVFYCVDRLSRKPRNLL